MYGKIRLLHLHKLFDNLGRIVPLRAQSFLSRRRRSKDFDLRIKPVPPGGNEAVPALLIAAQIHTHDFAVRDVLNKPPDAVRKVFLVHAAGARPAPFRENHDRLPILQKIRATFKNQFQLLAGTAAVDRNALGQITQNRQKEIALKIVSLRQIPGQPFITRKVAAETEGGIAQKEGVNHR